MKSVEVKCPTRVDLAGGTLDLWPLYSILGGATTVNIAVDIETRVRISEIGDDSISINVNDLNYSKKFINWTDFVACKDRELSLLSGPLKFFRKSGGLAIDTQSMSPVGGGLGGSSSMTIGLIEALADLNGNSLSVLEKVNLAHNLEAQLLATPTGTQDYFAPILKSGMVIIDYNLDKVTYEKIDIPSSFDEKFLLVYTGKPHHSGLNNWTVLKDFIDGKESTKKALEDLRNVAFAMRTLCKNQDWESLPQLFDEEYNARISLADAFASPEILRLKEIISSIGTSSLKICGAGGGGCVMIWTDSREAVESACQEEKFQVLKARPKRS